MTKYSNGIYSAFNPATGKLIKPVVVVEKIKLKRDALRDVLFYLYMLIASCAMLVGVIAYITFT